MRVSEELASSLDHGPVLQRLVALAVPEFADACCLELAAPSGPDTGETRLFWHAAARKEPVARQLAAVAPRHPGEARLFPRVNDAALDFLFGTDTQARARAHRLGLESVLVVPIRCGDRTLGEIRFAYAGSKRRYGRADLAMAVDLARRIATAMENTRLFREARLARAAADRAARRAALLAEASDSLLSTLDFDDRIGAVSRVVVPAFADGCLAVLFDDEGQPRPVVTAHRDPEKVSLLQRAAAAVKPGGRSPLAERVFAGEAVLVEADRERIEEFARAWGEELARAVERLECRSFLAIPMWGRGRVVGTLTLLSAGVYDADDIACARELAKRFAMALEHARLYRELQRSEERFRKTFEASPLLISIETIADSRIIDCNPQFLLVFGYERAEVIGRTVGELGIWADPGERPKVITQLLRDGAVRDVEYRFRARTGKLGTLRAAMELIELDGIPCNLCMAVDITEARALEEQLRQSQKMEAIGRLAGGVAHDFNNTLTAIRGYTELALERLGDDAARRYVEQIHRAAERASAMTGQLLAFSRKQVLQPMLLDVNRVVMKLEPMLRRLIREDVELVTRLQPDLGLIRADPVQIEQVLLNLAVNARDAMPRGGRLTVATRAVSYGDAGPRPPGVEPGRWVVLSVSDTGCGMDELTRARIFEPFFTTKPPGEGTGLGLSTVYGIVTQSGGHVGVESAPGQGTTFTLHLPLASDARLADTPPHGGAPAARRATETVLLVEDDDDVRELVAQMLKMDGYGVLVAANGSRAVELAREHAGPIHLVLTDVIMPGASGPEVVTCLRRHRPDLRVLYMSGYPGDALAAHGSVDLETNLLRKPFTRHALATKLREVLDAPRGASA